MRAYAESGEEARRARDLLRDWRGEGHLTAEQYQRMERDAVCDFRRTNIFLRAVLALFTLILVGAAVGLFFVVFLSHAGGQSIGAFLLFFSALCYATVEFAVAEWRLYRYGIEEALAACSVAFLCVGMQMAFFSSGRHAAEFLVPVAGAMASIWIWHRFGLPYAFLGAMIFVAWLPACWTSSQLAHHSAVAALYAAGVATVAALRPRYRFTWLESGYSIAEALLWLGICLSINLQASPLALLGHRWTGAAAAMVPRWFYWTTWALTWLLPPAVLTRGLRQRDRLVMAAGAVSAVLTLATNKPYLGWQRNTWDPMLLGALLIGVALFVRRWLAAAPGGVRCGFTAQRLSGRDKGWMGAGMTAVGLAAPQIVTPPAQASEHGVQYGGGDSGGAGATSSF